jgi:hypothetical protein
MMEIRDNDVVMLFDDGSGNAIDSVTMPEAHRRIAAFFTPTDGRGYSYGWPERQAADVLAAMFTGRAGT